MKIPLDPITLEQHFKEDNEGPLSNQGYMPYLNTFILDKVPNYSLLWQSRLFCSSQWDVLSRDSAGRCCTAWRKRSFLLIFIFETYSPSAPAVWCRYSLKLSFSINSAECKRSGPSGAGGVRHPRVQQDVLDVVLQEKNLHQTSGHLRRWRLQSLVRLQLPVGGRVPAGRRGRGGEDLAQNKLPQRQGFIFLPPLHSSPQVEYFLRRLTEAMGSGWSEEKLANYRLQLHPKSSLSAWDLIDLVGAAFCKGLHPQTVSMGISGVFQELILDVVKQVRWPVCCRQLSWFTVWVDRCVYLLHLLVSIFQPI